MLKISLIFKKNVNNSIFTRIKKVKISKYDF